MITSTPTQPTLGNTIIYTATVTGASNANAPTGALTWTLGGPATSCAPATLAATGSLPTQTIYTCTIVAAATGSYSATATYGGDSNYNAPAVASSGTITIAQVTPTLTLTGTGGGTLGSTLTYTATFTAPAGASAPTALARW